MLAVWHRPRVRSTRAAIETIQRGDFEQSAELAGFIDQLADDPRVTIDREMQTSLGASTDRVAWLSVASSDLADIAEGLRSESTIRGFVLLDLTDNFLVVPARRGARIWPQRPARAISLLREELRADNHPISREASMLRDELANVERPRTLAEAQEIVRDRPYAAIDLSRIRPPAVPLPFDPPFSLDHVTMLIEPPARSRARALTKLMAEVEDRRPSYRRRAVKGLMGWPASAEVYTALVRLSRDDEDLYTRALASLATAVRNPGANVAVMDLADALVAHAAASGEEWAASAASVAVLGAAVVAGHTRHPADRGRVLDCLQRLYRFPSEREHATDIKVALDQVPAR
jgi:hypothetical protein